MPGAVATMRRPATSSESLPLSALFSSAKRSRWAVSRSTWRALSSATPASEATESRKRRSSAVNAEPDSPRDSLSTTAR